MQARLSNTTVVPTVLQYIVAVFCMTVCSSAICHWSAITSGWFGLSLRCTSGADRAYDACSILPVAVPVFVLSAWLANDGSGADGKVIAPASITGGGIVTRKLFPSTNIV